jgi:Domain of unknown function (DUF4288)
MWFSTSVRLIMLVEGEEPGPSLKSVFVFDAPGWGEARREALRLGRTKETRYQNGAGCRVRWALLEVMTLDELGLLEESGTEVYSEALDPDAGTTILTFDSVVNPEQMEPGSSGVPTSVDQVGDLQSEPRRGS